MKKACIADSVAPFVDQYCANPQSYGAASAWIGCSFMRCRFTAISPATPAVARLPGYSLTINFNFPYFARSVTDFWRRWHISLSSWLRDYLYISLGGNRGSLLFTYRNMLLTMLLGGLWHGAS